MIDLNLCLRSVKCLVGIDKSHCEVTLAIQEWQLMATLRSRTFGATEGAA